MPDDFVINVRQISQYQFVSPALAADLVLLQRGGLGGPYVSITAADLVATALAAGGPLGVGVTPPTDAEAHQIFTSDLSLEIDEGIMWNAYATGPSTTSYLQNGFAGLFTMYPNGHFVLESAPVGVAGTPNWQAWQVILEITTTGYMVVHDQITVARDPVAEFEVMTWGLAQELRANSVVSFNGRTGQITLVPVDIIDAGGAPIDSPAFIGTPTSPFISDLTDNSNLIANTAFVQGALRTAPFVRSFNGRTGEITLLLSDIECAGGAPIRSPNFIGWPTAPTPPFRDVSTRIATTEFVHCNIEKIVAWWKEHCITLDSPNFTGRPTAPTPPQSDYSNRIATTKWVTWQIEPILAALGFLEGRVDALELTSAPLHSPHFTGEPTAPTPPQSDYSDRIATTRWVAWQVNPLKLQIFALEDQITQLQGDIESAPFLPLAGGTMTGMLTLAGPPINPNDAATKEYVDVHGGGGGGSSLSIDWQHPIFVDMDANLPEGTWALTSNSNNTRPPADAAAPDGGQVPYAIQFAVSDGAVWMQNPSTAYPVTFAGGGGGGGDGLTPIPNATMLGNVSGATAIPVAMNQTQVKTLVGLFSSGGAGLTPESDGVANHYLRADGNWTDPIGLAGGPFLPLTGGTITGDLAINKSWPMLNLINGDGGSFARFLYGDTGTFMFSLNRMGIGAASVMEVAPPGFLATVFGDPIAPLGIATKQYVDNAVAGGGSGSFLPLSGGTLTGALTLAPVATVAPALILNAGGAQPASITSQRNGSTRWVISPNNGVAESGSNTGSNFAISRFADNGTLIDVPLYITRSTGIVTLQQMPVNSMDVATKQYVDNAVGSIGIGPFLPLVGGTLGGNLTIAPIGMNALLTLNKSSGAGGLGSSIFGTVNSVNRWVLSLATGAAESSGNAGSDFVIGRYDDAGAFIDLPMQIFRATGVTTFTHDVIIAEPGVGVPSHLVINKQSDGVNSSIMGQRQGLTRWNLIVSNNTVESGGNSGSDFGLSRYNDAGAIIDTPILVTRAGGVLQTPNGQQLHDLYLGGADFNTAFTIGGMYRVVGQANSPDGSTTGSWWVEVTTVATDPTFQLQRAFLVGAVGNTVSAWMRAKLGGSWTPWSNLMATSGGNPLKVNLNMSYSGKPAALQISPLAITFPVTIPANFVGSHAVASAIPTATAVFGIYLRVGGVGQEQLGTVTFSPGTAIGAFAGLPSGVALGAGDYLFAYAPTPQDATLSDVAIGVNATRL